MSKKTSVAWSADFEPPQPPDTTRLRLEVLGPSVVELDYAAIMGSRARLRQELQWGTQRPWPADDFTVEENLGDLARHQQEYERREAYAYTVLDPAGEVCLGCIYLEPFGDDARLAFWVIDAEIETQLETHLLQTVFQWIAACWPFERIVVPLREGNPRGIALVRSHGLQPLAEGELAGHSSFVWMPR